MWVYDYLRKEPMYPASEELQKKFLEAQSNGLSFINILRHGYEISVYIAPYTY